MITLLTSGELRSAFALSPVLVDGARIAEISMIHSDLGLPSAMLTGLFLLLFEAKRPH